MPNVPDGSVVIETDLNTEKVSGSVGQLEKLLKGLIKSVDSLTKAINAQFNETAKSVDSAKASAEELNKELDKTPRKRSTEVDVDVDASEIDAISRKDVDLKVDVNADTADLNAGVGKMSDGFTVAADSLGLLEQKFSNINRQITEQQNKVSALEKEYQSAVNAGASEDTLSGISGKITAAQAKLIGLQETANKTSDKIAKIKVAAEKQDIEIEVTADTSQAEKAVDKSSNQIISNSNKTAGEITKRSSETGQKVKHDFEDAGSRSSASLDSLADRAKAAFGKLTAAMAAAFSIKTVVDFGKSAVSASNEAANALQGLQSIMEGQGRNFGNATGWIQDYISDGLIPMQNAVTAYKNLASRGYDDTQIQNVLTALKDSSAYGRQSSYSMGEAVQTATEGLKNENSILVDNAGVTKNVAKMWDDYAASIGTTSAKLTQEQKIQAEVNGIIEETKFQQGDAAKISEGFSGQLSRLSYAFNELKVTVGNVLTQALTPIIKVLGEGIAKLTGFVKQLSELMGVNTDTLNSGAAESASSVAESTSEVAENYADAAESAEAAAEAGENQLASFDKVNKLGDSSDDSSGTNTALSPTKSSDGLQGNISVKADVDISEAEAEFEKLFKDIKKSLSGLFKPFKKAWNKDGKKVTDSLKYAFEEIVGLCAEIGRSFGKVWTNGTGEKTVGHILGIFTNINTTIGNIARNLGKAWTKDNLGTDIVQNVADIFNTILIHIENISKKTSDWSGKLDFTPALTALRDLSAALEPFADTVGKGLETFYDEVLLPLGKWTVENAVPTFLETLADVITGLQKVWETAAPVIKDKLWDGFLKPIAEWTADAALSALGGLGDGIKKIGESLTEKEVSVLIDLSGAIAAVCLAAKSYKTIGNLSESFRKLGDSVKGMGTKTAAGLKAWNQPLSTPAAEGGTTFATKFCAAAAAFFTGWEIGTAIRDAIGGDKIDEALFPIFDGIVNFFTETIPCWWETLQEDTLFPFYDKAVGAWNAVVTFLTESIPAFFTETIPGWWSSWTEDLMFPIYDKAVAAWNAVVTFFTESIPTFFTQTVPQWFSDLWEAIKEVFSGCIEWWSALFSDAWNGIVSVWETVVGFFQGVWNGITGVFSAVGEWFGNAFSGAWANIKSAFSSVKSFFGGIWDGIKSAFSSVGSWFKNTFSAAWEGVKNVFSTGGRIFSGIKDGISEVFTDTVNKINSYISSRDRVFWDIFLFPRATHEHSYYISIAETSACGAFYLISLGSRFYFAAFDRCANFILSIVSKRINVKALSKIVVNRSLLTVNCYLLTVQLCEHKITASAGTKRCGRSVTTPNKQSER